MRHAGQNPRRRKGCKDAQAATPDCHKRLSGEVEAAGALPALMAVRRTSAGTAIKDGRCSWISDCRRLSDRCLTPSNSHDSVQGDQGEDTNEQAAADLCLRAL